MGSQPTISETEMAVLKVLWELNSGTVREVLDALHQHGRTWAYTTVQTLLGRLQTKGYVVCEKGAQAHVFQPAFTRERLLRLRLNDLAEEFCEGTSSPLVLALVETGQFTPEEIAQMRELLDRLDPDSSHKKGK